MIPPEWEYLTVEFEPEGNPYLPFEVGELLEQQGNLDGAATLYNRAYGLAPDNLEIKTRFKQLLDRLAIVEHGLAWRYIPGGVFLMGNNNGEPDEKPWHPVWLEPYWVLETCVSWSDFERLLGWEETQQNGAEIIYPSDARFDFLREDPHALHLTDRLAYEYSCGQSPRMSELRLQNDPNSRRTDLKPYTAVPYLLAELLGIQLSTEQIQYRVPTEAEWEKAARGGLIGAPYSWGWEEPTPELIDCQRFYDFGIKPMKSLPPNGYGLYAMCGSVWEWTSDFYDREFYRETPHESPIGPKQGEHRVLRGGSWADCPEVCTVSYRMSLSEESSIARGRDHLTPTVGFRLVRTKCDSGD